MHIRTLLSYINLSHPLPSSSFPVLTRDTKRSERLRSFGKWFRLIRQLEVRKFVRKHLDSLMARFKKSKVHPSPAPAAPASKPNTQPRQTPAQSSKQNPSVNQASHNKNQGSSPNQATQNKNQGSSPSQANQNKNSGSSPNQANQNKNQGSSPSQTNQNNNQGSSSNQANQNKNSGSSPNQANQNKNSEAGTQAKQDRPESQSKQHRNSLSPSIPEGQDSPSPDATLSQQAGGAPKHSETIVPNKPPPESNNPPAAANHPMRNSETNPVQGKQDKQPVKPTPPFQDTGNFPESTNNNKRGQIIETFNNKGVKLPEVTGMPAVLFEVMKYASVVTLPLIGGAFVCCCRRLMSMGELFCY